MRREIWKFELRFGRPLVTPGVPHILSVGQQDGRPYLWALIDPEAAPRTRDILVLGTGHDATSLAIENREFLGTIIDVEGGLVLHVFDADRPF